MNILINNSLRQPLLFLSGFFIILFLAEDNYCEVVSPDEKTTTAIFLDEQGRLNYVSYSEGVKAAGPAVLELEDGVDLGGIKCIYQVGCRKVESGDPYVVAEFVISYDEGNQTLTLKHFNSRLQYLVNTSDDTSTWRNIRLAAGQAMPNVVVLLQDITIGVVS